MAAPELGGEIVEREFKIGGGRDANLPLFRRRGG
jgi:hypothetical protein